MICGRPRRAPGRRAGCGSRRPMPIRLRLCWMICFGCTRRAGDRAANLASWPIRRCMPFIGTRRGRCDAEGMLRLYRMRIGEAVAAVYYGFAWRSRAYAYLGGFDPDMPRLSPGALIVWHAIGAAMAEGCAGIRFPAGRRALQIRLGCGRSSERGPDVAQMSDAARSAVAAYRRGDISAEIALMRVCSRPDDAAAVINWLEAVGRSRNCCASRGRSARG